MNESITTTVTAGELRGVRVDGVDRYLGVPYAAAPIGDLRFAEAAPATVWDGVRDATQMGPTAPQNPLSPVSGRYLPNVIAPGDEYLNVNVWAPAEGDRRPVLVWIHGGSLKHGSNAIEGYDGTAFARDGVILVSMNYRLGFEGFSVLQDAPLNLGFTDMIAALRWVQREIAAFGGDPDNVTIAGESAGAVAVADLLVGAHAGTLFHRVIIQSGMPTGTTKRSAGAVTRSEAKRLRSSATVAAFSAVSMEKMLEVDREVTQNPDRRVSSAGYSPVIGGPAIERDPLTAALEGSGDRIPVLAGWTSEEHTFFMLGGAFDKIGRLLFGLMRLKYGANARVVQAYRQAYPGTARGTLLAIMTIDQILRIPMHRIADGRLSRGAAPTWFYEFDWKSPVDDLGATHAMELPFVFDTLWSDEWSTLTGSHPPQRLANEMHASWVRFAKTGDPGWRSWDLKRPSMVFSETPAQVVDGPRDAQLAVWRKRRGDRA